MSHLTKILLLGLILAAVVVLPSFAAKATSWNWTESNLNWTPEYPQEYYSLGSLVDNYLSAEHVNNSFQNQLDWNSNLGAYASLASARELRRQTILLEQQNELLAEQNALLANQSLVGHKIICTGSVPGTCNEWTVI